MYEFINKVRQYLQEWRDEQAIAEKYAQNPESVPNFSWHWHEKELISIQGAIRYNYERADAEVRASLTAAEVEEIETILKAEID